MLFYEIRECHRWLWRRCWTVLFVLCLLTRQSCALIDSFTWNLPPGLSFYGSEPFGFFVGGVYNVTIADVDSNPVNASATCLIQLCNSEEADSIPSNGYDCHSTVNLLAQRTCAIAAELVPYSLINLEGTITSADTYSMALFSCFPDTRSLSVQVLFLNPNDNQLSSTQENLPNIFLASVFAWLCLTLSWIINKLMHWKLHIRLHNLLFIIFFMRLLVCGLTYLHWQTIIKQGFSNTSIDDLEYVAFFFFEFFLFMAFIFVSKGWCIINASLDRSGERSVSLVILGAILLVVYAVYSSYYLVAVIITYIVILRYAFVNLTVNTHFLEVQAAYVSQHAGIQSRNFVIIQHKIRLLKIFQRLLGTYMFLTVLSLVGIRFFVPAALWLQTSSIEVLDFCLGVAMFSLFYLRDFNAVLDQQAQITNEISRATNQAPASVALPPSLAALNPAIVAMGEISVPKVPVVLVQSPVAHEKRFKGLCLATVE